MATRSVSRAGRAQSRSTSHAKPQDSPKEVLKAFGFFKALRNKHYVNDENAYQQCVVAAMIGDGTAYRRIAGIIPFVMTVKVCTGQHVDTFARLTGIAMGNFRKREVQDRSHAVSRASSP